MKLIPIGQFSKVTGLTPKALRIYDEIGLLKPAFTDPSSNYRYYQPDQIGRGQKIRILRSLEMSLEDINRFLETNSLNAKNLLDEHKAKLRNQIDLWQESIDELDRLLENKTIIYEINNKKTNSMIYAYIRRQSSIATIGQVMDKTFATIFQHLGRLRIEPIAPAFGAYPDPKEFDADDFEIDCCVPIAKPITLAENDEVKCKTTPEQQVIYTVHKGSYHGIPGAYEALINYVSQNNLEIIDSPRETYIFGALHTKNQDEYRTEIVFPIKD